MGVDDEIEIPPGGCHMCLAIPGKIVEIASGNPNSALVDVVGMRRRVDLGLLKTTSRCRAPISSTSDSP